MVKRVFVILVLALFCCGFIPQHIATRQDSQRATEYYTEAIKSLSILGDSVKAKEHLQRVLEIDANHAPALVMLSKLTRDAALRAQYVEAAYLTDTSNLHYVRLYRNSLMETQRFKEAVPMAQRLVERSTDPRDYYILCVLLEGTGRLEEGIAILDSANVRLGRISALSQMRQDMLIKAGRVLEAEAEAKRGVEEEPYSVQNYISLAKVYVNTNRDSLALNTYLKALEVDTEDLDLLASLGDFFLKKDLVEEYLVVLEKLFSHKNVEAKTSIAMWNNIKTQTPLYSKYYTQYDRLIKALFTKHPNNNEVVRLYIEHLIVSGQVEQAVKHQKVLIEGSTKPLIKDYLYMIYMEKHLNRPDSVAKYTNRALELFPNNLDVLVLNSEFAKEKGDYDEALTHSRNALKCTENDTLRSQLWCEIGDIEQHRKRTKASYKAYEKALRLYPDNAVALNNYAYLLSVNDTDLELALTMATRAIALSERNATYLDTMAWIFYKLGRYEEAKRYMQQALSLDRDKSPELALHYGDILFALGDKFMAELYWRKALERGYEVKAIEERFQKSKQK